jgi:hypothetical protein
MLRGDLDVLMIPAAVRLQVLDPSSLRRPLSPTSLTTIASPIVTAILVPTHLAIQRQILRAMDAPF